MSEFLILFLAATSAAAISGAAGFGGALLLLPLLVWRVGPLQAVPLLTVAQLVGNLSRVGLGARQIRWKPVVLFLVGAAPSSLLGAWVFVEIPKELVTRAVGVLILAVVALKWSGRLKFETTGTVLVLGGALVGFLSGLVGSAGPLGAAIFLSLGLPPVAYIASEAVTATVMHGLKMLVYQQAIPMDRGFWSLALVLGIGMVLGSWIGKRVIEKLPQERFQRYVVVLLVLLAGYMFVHG